MFKMYRTDMETNITVETKEYIKGNWINMVSPSDEEIKTVCENIGIQEDFIRYALDSEEKARIDVEDDDNTILFIIDTPIMEIESGAKVYSTMPIGVIFVRDDYIITVSLSKNPIMEELTKKKNRNMITYKKSRMLLQIFYSNAEMFLSLLKKLNKETEIAENVLKNSMKNKELLKLLSLEKGLVYFTTSLKSNEVVMEKTMRGNLIKLYDDDEDILEDAIIENKQAIEMARIHRDILSGTMDAYASIISNNLNGVMKYLTSITIILAIPTMIASYWGMNVPVPLQDNPIGFIAIVLISILIGVIATLWLKRKGMLDWENGDSPKILIYEKLGTGLS